MDTETSKLLNELADQLASDYDVTSTVDAAGYTFTLTREPDFDSHINYWDCYGAIAPVERDRYICHDAPRPPGFTGNAEKLHLAHGERCWWEPPLEMMGLTVAEWRTDRERRDRERRLVLDILNYGFDIYSLEIVDTEGRSWYDALGSIEPSQTSHGFVPEVVADMLWNWLAELRFHDQQVFLHHLRNRHAATAA